MHPVDKQLKAFNEKDLQVFSECYSDNIQVSMFETDKILTKGKDQLTKIMKESFDSSPNSKTNVISRIYQNNLVIELEKITGHIKGKTITTISIYEISENKITRLWFGGRLVQ